jgi:hypothetical protein
MNDSYRPNPNRWFIAGVIAALTLVIISPIFAGSFQRTNLASDIAGSNQTDPNLVNPWGISANPTGPFWISDNGTGLASVYAISDRHGHQPIGCDPSATARISCRRNSST